jgi:Spy/CpxP family protein refolding chaperone
MKNLPKLRVLKMFEKFLYLLVVIAILLSPSISSAKDIPPGRWWRVPYFADQLNINDSQKDELDKLFDHNRDRLAELKQQMEQEKRDLMQMIEGEHLNENDAKAQMKKLESTRTILSATRFSYSLEVRKLLGHDRFQQLKTLYRNWHGISDDRIPSTQ